MADGADTSASSPWHQNSRIVSAVISSAFGLMGTVATIVAMRQSAPPVPPQAAAAIVAPPSAGPAPSAVGQPSMPAELMNSEAPSQAAAPRPAANLLLNFSDFQARLASPGLSADERDRIVRPLLGHTVVWKGYVDSVTGMSEPTADAAITVTLVESPDKLNQSLFKMPAHFRFRSEALEELAALAVGDRVILSGTLTDHSIVATNVTDAHVMSVNDRPAVRAATGPDRSPKH
jgi:hypothetical protein